MSRHPLKASRRSASRALAAGAALALLSALPALAAAIRITSPDGKAPVFGEIEIAVELGTKDPVSEVALFVDGSLVARLRHAPFRFKYDVGQLNLEHQFVAEATTLFGARLRATRATPAMEVGEEVQVEMVQLYVRLGSEPGAQRRTLGPDDFKVSDETGARQTVNTVVDGNVPISTVVLVDSSDSMKGEAFRQAVAGAETTAGLLGKEDEVMVALFSDRLLRASEFTHDRAALSSALQGVEANGGSAVYDHLYFALNRLKTRLGRPVIVLFSDGEDVTSTLDAENVRWRARRSQATLYWVRVEAPDRAERRFATFWRDGDEVRRQKEELEAAVNESGGGILAIRDVSELDQALVKIYDDLRAQYVVGFYPENRRHDGSWRPITVRGADSSLRLTARAGYVDN